VERSDGRPLDPIIAAAGAIGLVGLIWLAPLMFDQLVFFADRDQTRQAEASRQAMLPAAGLVLAAAVGLVMRGRRWHALLVALPVLVAVPLAFILPSAGYQLLAYGFLAPVALSAVLSAVFPLPRSVPIAVQLVGLGLIAILGVLGTPFIAIIALLALAVWWRLPRPEGRIVTEGRPQGRPPG
jgi:hypothetical protein